MGFPSVPREWPQIQVEFERLSVCAQTELVTMMPTLTCTCLFASLRQDDDPALFLFHTDAPEEVAACF